MLIDLPLAKKHLRVSGSTAEDGLIAMWAAAAELSAMKFMNRNVYASSAELAAAIEAVPALRDIASAAYQSALDAAASSSGEVERRFAIAEAESAYREAFAGIRRISHGIVLNDLIKAAMLLILGHLYENRQDVVVAATASGLPKGSEHLLQPFRCQMGI